MPEIISRQKCIKQLFQDGLKKAMTYPEYRILVVNLGQEDKIIGAEPTVNLAGYTLLNDRRINRLERTLK